MISLPFLSFPFYLIFKKKKTNEKPWKRLCVQWWSNVEPTGKKESSPTSPYYGGFHTSVTNATYACPIHQASGSSVGLDGKLRCNYDLSSAVRYHLLPFAVTRVNLGSKQARTFPPSIATYLKSHSSFWQHILYLPWYLSTYMQCRYVNLGKSKPPFSLLQPTWYEENM